MPQCGHGCQAVETRPNSVLEDALHIPQCGHGRQAVETVERHPGGGHRLRAAMGPRPSSRGDPAARPARTTPVSSSNGATAVEPWRPDAGGGLREPGSAAAWGHGHRARDTPGSRVRPPSSRGCRNGARAIGPWRLDQAIHHPVVTLAAMGPRPPDRGYRNTGPLPHPLEAAWGHGR